MATESEVQYEEFICEQIVSQDDGSVPNVTPDQVANLVANVDVIDRSTLAGQAGQLDSQVRIPVAGVFSARGL